MAELRRNAEERLRKKGPHQKPKAITAKAKADAERLLHELQVHQVELETQNIELQESRNRMEALLEKYTDLYDFAPVGYFSLDERGWINEVNLTGATLLGVERSRLIQQPLLHFVEPASQPAFLACLKLTMAGTGNHTCKVALMRKDAGEFWARLIGKTGIAGNGSRKCCRIAVWDITSLVRAEEAQERLARIVEFSDDAIIGKDLNSVIFSWNKGAQKIFGYTAREMVGTSVTRLIPAGRQAEEKQTLGKIRLGKSMQHFETLRRTKNGRLINVSITASPIKDDKGRIIGVSKIVRDITERKRAEATLRRADELAAANLKLKEEIVRRQAVQDSLKQSEGRQRQLLEQSRLMHDQLRHLSRQVLKVQEEERKRISRELHDAIAQTLAGINIRLATLKGEAGGSMKSFDLEKTRKLLAQSVEVVHQFARELRPAVLDIGLTPALQAFVKDFSERTLIHVHLKIPADIEELDSNQRTILYRVAQEALANVARHAKAGQVDLDIARRPGRIRMRIHDNGKSFNVERTLRASDGKRLGLLGMRERVEMVGGQFKVVSAPGQGTTIEAQIPLGNHTRKAAT